ncbi:MAG: Superoxide dismutase, partial [Caulobacteraceae bacterium]|nr:Superoxide dismutase [Caulobacteraceae bacterium]
AWNHAFFWEAMTPDRAPAPTRFAALKDRFLETGAAHFGSGWVWITVQDGELAVADTHDAGNWVGQDAKPLLVCDLWEHAYYLDYKNERPAFLERWWEETANWAFAAAQLAAAGAGRGWTFDQAA